jgi:hypothetical protein
MSPSLRGGTAAQTLVLHTSCAPACSGREWYAAIKTNVKKWLRFRDNP